MKQLIQRALNFSGSTFPNRNFSTFIPEVSSLKWSQSYRTLGNYLPHLPRNLWTESQVLRLSQTPVELGMLPESIINTEFTTAINFKERYFVLTLRNF